MLQDKTAYSKRVQDFVKKYASTDFKLKNAEDDDAMDEDRPTSNGANSNSSAEQPIDDIVEEEIVENFSDVDDEPEPNPADDMVL